MACNTSSIAQNYRDSYTQYNKNASAERKPMGKPTGVGVRIRYHGVTLTALTHLDPPLLRGHPFSGGGPSSFTRESAARCRPGCVTTSYKARRHI